jgi:sugar phosphate isomerase/epimerase
MYFAMDEIGFENDRKIKAIDSEAEKWRFLYDTAKTYGFEGIHVTPGLYESFGLDVNNIPEYFQEFKLTFHLSGIYNAGKLAAESEYEAFDRELEKRFKTALKHHMHDISFHPPGIEGLTQDEKDLSAGFLRRIIDKWLKTALRNNISFSMETHVFGEAFLFDGLREYVKFIDDYPDLGVLIDISHNYFNGYSEDDIINILGGKNVKALHISDALQNAELRQGTHLPIGNGTVDLTKLLKHFGKIPNIFGALEIKSNNGDLNESVKKLKEVLC